MYHVPFFMLGSHNYPEREQRCSHQGAGSCSGLEEKEATVLRRWYEDVNNWSRKERLFSPAKGKRGRREGSIWHTERRSSSNSLTMWWNHYFRTLRYSSEASSGLTEWRHSRRIQSSFHYKNLNNSMQLLVTFLTSVSFREIYRKTSSVWPYKTLNQNHKFLMQIHKQL